MNTLTHTSVFSRNLQHDHINRPDSTLTSVKSKLRLLKAKNIFCAVVFFSNLRRRVDDRLQLTFNWDLDTLPHFSTSSEVKAYQMDLSSSDLKSMSDSCGALEPQRSLHDAADRCAAAAVGFHAEEGG